MTWDVIYYILLRMKSQVLPLEKAIELKRLARGVLTPIKTSKAGKVFYCLQYGRKGKHVSKYVPADELDAYREATENYRLFMEAVDNYVEGRSAATAEEIRKEAKARKRGKDSKCASRSLPRDASASARRSPRNG